MLPPGHRGRARWRVTRRVGDAVTSVALGQAGYLLGEGLLGAAGFCPGCGCVKPFGYARMPDVIVNKAIYCDGVRQAISGDISDAVADARGRGDCFLWIGLHEPTQEEFDLITSEVSLHPLAVEDA